MHTPSTFPASAFLLGFDLVCLPVSATLRVKRFTTKQHKNEVQGNAEDSR